MFFKADIPHTKFVYVQDKSPSAVENFISDVQNRIENEPINSDLLQDPNLNYDILEAVVTDAKNKFMPFKKKKFNKYKHKLSPWISQGIIRSIKFRDNLYNRLKLLPLESELHHTTKINLTTCNKILQKSIRAAKFSYYNDQFTKYKSDSRKTWSTISSIMSRKNNGKNHPDYFLLNNARISDKKNISEKFNTFFTNIGPKLSNEIPAPQGISYKTFLKQKISCAFNFNLVEVKDIINTINKLAPKSSCGYDNISTKLLKQLSPIVSPFITVIINQSLCTGIFPDKLKIAKVLPLFKKGNIHLFDNYRPISLLPSISKVFEKNVYKQVYDYFLTHKLIYNSQYGFRHLHSTELAALELSD